MSFIKMRQALRYLKAEITENSNFLHTIENVHTKLRILRTDEIRGSSALSPTLFAFHRKRNNMQKITLWQSANKRNM